MIEVLKPNLTFVKGDDSTDRYGRFVLEPLQRGYGTTIGNALRRIMLSSMSGACISNVRIDGVLHEFSVIPGVKDDVTDIILNLKKVVLRTMSDAPQTLTLRKKGRGVVTAADIEANTNVVVVDGKDTYIAEVTDDKTELVMELQVEKGTGYRLARKNTKGEFPLSTIFLDCHFTPIRKVNFRVDDARVGQELNYDKLVLEVWTNGALMPDEAVKLSAKMLQAHLGLLIDFDVATTYPEEEYRMIVEEKKEENKAFDIPIKELEFSVRSRNCLEQENIRTLGELAKKRASDLLAIKNFGKKSLFEIREKLAQYGLHLADEGEGGNPA